jgi:hypothetical protein
LDGSPGRIRRNIARILPYILDPKLQPVVQRNLAAERDQQPLQRIVGHRVHHQGDPSIKRTKT